MRSLAHLAINVIDPSDDNDEEGFSATEAAAAAAAATGVSLATSLIVFYFLLEGNKFSNRPEKHGGFAAQSFVEFTTEF